MFTCKCVFELVIPIIFILIAIYKDKIERKWGNIPFITYYKTTFIELIFLFVIVFPGEYTKNDEIDINPELVYELLEITVNAIRKFNKLFNQYYHD